MIADANSAVPADEPGSTKNADVLGEEPALHLPADGALLGWVYPGHVRPLDGVRAQGQVELIDELVFPEGWEAALKIELVRRSTGCTGVRSCSTVRVPKTLAECVV